MATPQADAKIQLRARIRSARRERAAAAGAHPAASGRGSGDAVAAAAGFASAVGAAVEQLLHEAGDGQPTALLGYAALPGEPDIDAVLDAARAAGHTVYLPVTIPGQPLRFGRLSCAMADLQPAGSWQIREPESEFSAAEAVAGDAVRPALGAALVPGLAYSREGFRLGNGGGFYDRTFGPAGEVPGASASVSMVGVCFAEEVIAGLAADSWDLQVSALLTEAGLERCATERS